MFKFAALITTEGDECQEPLQSEFTDARWVAWVLVCSSANMNIHKPSRYELYTLCWLHEAWCDTWIHWTCEAEIQPIRRPPTATTATASCVPWQRLSFVCSICQVGRQSDPGQDLAQPRTVTWKSKREEGGMLEVPLNQQVWQMVPSQESVHMQWNWTLLFTFCWAKCGLPEGAS